jgi:competence protein ComEA
MKGLALALFAAALSVAPPVFAGSIDPLLVSQAAPAQIDINRAKVEELMTLKGVGDARAKAIVKGRPYARKDELVQKKIIPQSLYDEIKDKIIAKQ